MGVTCSIGRGGSMRIWTKEPLKDITAIYFNHEVWNRSPESGLVPDMPLDVQLELVNFCNLSCEACSSNYHTRKKSFLSWDVLNKIIYESAQEGVCYFTICGIGEASLHPDLFKLLRLIRDYNVVPKGLRQLTMMPSVLITNAVWNDYQLNECLKNPPDLLSCSLAGLTNNEIEERRCGLNIDRFYKIIHNIYNNRFVIRETDGGVLPIIHVSTHIFPHEIETRKQEISNFIQCWLEVSDAVIIKPTMISQHYNRYENFLPISEEPNLNYTNITLNNFERSSPCMETSRRLAIDSDGNVWCGHHNSEDFGAYLGNVYQQSLREIWHGETMNNFRKEVRRGIFNRYSCKTCGGEIRDCYRT